MPRRTVIGEGKKLPLNMRTTAGLRAKINKAAGKSGRSLVQEVEYRVEESFHREQYSRLHDDVLRVKSSVLTIERRSWEHGENLKRIWLYLSLLREGSPIPPELELAERELVDG